MDKDIIIGATDLTMKDKRIESNNGVSPPKRPKIEFPLTSPPLPVLEPVIPVPEFNLAVAESQLATCPPILQPEIEIPPMSLAKDCQPSTSNSVRTGPKASSPAIQQFEERHISMMPPFKNINRCSKVSSGSLPKQQLEAILEKTKFVLKNSSGGFSLNSGRNEMVKARFKPVVTTPGPKPQTRSTRRSTTVVKEPEQVKKLEARYAANPNPAPSEVHEIAEELNITTKDVKKWFTAHRRQVGVKTHDSPDSGFADAPGTSANAIKSQRLYRRFVETSGIAGKSVPDRDIQDQSRHHHGVQGTSHDKPGNGMLRCKFLRETILRTDDLDVIKRDAEKLKECPLYRFQRILEKNWEVKANRLLTIAATEGLEFKATVYKESKRLKHISDSLNLFSDEQEEEVFKWKNRFIHKKVEEGKHGDYITVKSNIESNVIPWIAPFMYSRTTQQDDRHLTLVVALHDFSKISDDPQTTSVDWITPSLLQTDYNLPQ